MAYRAARDSDMTGGDWDAIAGRLAASYRRLNQVMTARPR